MDHIWLQGGDRLNVSFVLVKTYCTVIDHKFALGIDSAFTDYKFGHGRSRHFQVFRLIGKSLIVT